MSENPYQIPGYAIPIDSTDRLFLRVITSQASKIITMRYRYIDETDGLNHGQIQVVPAISPTVNLSQRLIGGKYLLELIIHEPARTLLYGEMLVQAGILNGGTTLDFATHLLLNDFLTGDHPVGLHTSPARIQQKNPPSFGYITVADPAAGADWTHTIPAGEDWIVHSVRAQYLASATAANREAHLRVITDAATGLWQIAPGYTIVASDLVFINWFPEATKSTGLAGLTGAQDTVNVPMARFRAIAGWKIQVTTAGIQAGDQWDEIRIAREKIPAL